MIDIKNEPGNLLDMNERIRYMQGDIRDRVVLHDLLSYPIDGVIHLGAVSRVIWGEQDPNSCVDINVHGTRLLLDAIERSGQRPWLIFGSSREVYGVRKRLPVSENCRKAPINVYGNTKLLGEELVREFSRSTGMNTIILRFSNVYGNEYDILDRVIPRFVLRSLKGLPLKIHGGKQLVDFTHINDTIEGILKAIDIVNDRGFYGTNDFHILPGIGTSLQDVVKIIADHTGAEPEIQYEQPRVYDVDKFVGNPAKARSQLGFSAMIKPETGIRMTVDRYAEVFEL